MQVSQAKNAVLWKSRRFLSIIRARKARTAGVVVDGLSRDPETHTAKSARDADDGHVEGCQDDLAWRGKVHALIHEEPEDWGEAEGEPTGKESSLVIN